MGRFIDMVDHMEASALKPVEDQEIFISHGDCEDDVEFLKSEITKRLGCTNFTVNILDPVIGAHAGPGTLALFFMADKR